MCRRNRRRGRHRGPELSRDWQTGGGPSRARCHSRRGTAFSTQEQRLAVCSNSLFGRGAWNETEKMALRSAKPARFREYSWQNPEEFPPRRSPIILLQHPARRGPRHGFPRPDRAGRRGSACPVPRHARASPAGPSAHGTPDRVRRANGRKSRGTGSRGHLRDGAARSASIARLRLLPGLPSAPAPVAGQPRMSPSAGQRSRSLGRSRPPPPSESRPASPLLRRPLPGGG